MLNMPGVEALNVAVELVAPKLTEGVVDGAEKLNPVAEFEVIAPNWKGVEVEVETAALLLVMLLLVPKENEAVPCCDAF